MIAGAAPGLEVVHPMAIVVLGGLVTSTLVSLFVVPALYLRFGGRGPELPPEEELMQRWAGVEPAAAEAPAGCRALRRPTHVDSDSRWTGNGQASRVSANVDALACVALVGRRRARLVHRGRVETAEGYEPATLEAIKGDGDLKRVTSPPRAPGGPACRPGSCGRTAGQGRPVPR